jgi:hypothetical protein
MEQQRWNLGPAAAEVFRMPTGTMVDVRGVVTASAFEGLHMRLALEPPGVEQWIVLGWSALLAVTNKSAVEAALRGSRPGQPHAIVVVPGARLKWAKHHCLLMSGNGVSRAPYVSVLEQATQAA